MNKITGKFAWRLIAGFTTVLAWAASAAAQTVVVGTGDPDVDVPAVQAAVDQGGDVILQGHFSFDRPPTVPTANPFFPGLRLATVLVSRDRRFPVRLPELKEIVSAWRGPGTLVLVTHAQTVWDWLGFYPAQGEVVVLRPGRGADADLVGRVFVGPQ